MNMQSRLTGLRHVLLATSQGMLLSQRQTRVLFCIWHALRTLKEIVAYFHIKTLILRQERKNINNNEQNNHELSKMKKLL